MAVDLAQLLATGAASAIGAAAAGAIGFRYAVARFRKERAFDRRLTWYETAVRDLVDGSGKIIRAVNTVRRPHLASGREAAWRDAGDALGRLLSLEAEAELYATDDAYYAISRAAEDIRAVSKAAERLASSGPQPASATPSDEQLAKSLQMYDIVSKLMLHAASRLARDVRQHLELDDITRDWRAYDHELERHLQDVERLGLRTPDSSPAATDQNDHPAPAT
jgi:hypothetical protein